MKKSIRKLKRIELVELIYHLRRENIKLRKRCKHMAKQLEQTEQLIGAQAAQVDTEALERIERMLAKLCEHREEQA